MIRIAKTPQVDAWMRDLRDDRARARIADRIQRLAQGNPGDAKAVGEGVLELRLAYGPGYRVYYTLRGRVLAILLCGGDKSTQAKDIKAAKAIAKGLE